MPAAPRPGLEGRVKDGAEDQVVQPAAFGSCNRVLSGVNRSPDQESARDDRPDP